MPHPSLNIYISMKPVLLLFIWSILSSFCAHAQGPLDGYMKGRGNLDLAPSVSLNNATRFSGLGGQLYQESYSGRMLSLFAEYGVTERFDLVGVAAAVFTEARSGLQDGGLYVKYRIFQENTSAKSQLSLILATGASFPISDYEPTASGALGQKAVVAPVRLITQWASPWGVFVNLTGGYNWRLDDLKEEDIAKVRKFRPDYAPDAPPDFTTLLFKVGFPARHYYLDAWVEKQFTKGGANYIQDVPDLPQAWGVSYTQVGGVFYYSPSGKNGVYVSGGYFINGRNTSLLSRLTFGAVFKL
ncbi:MAG: hypothetical protein IT269_04340 [Saprospiraceae bacterium]|nr:hypothetical protein [Saprospiraceae bacterium]